MPIHTLFSGFDAEVLKDFDSTGVYTYDKNKSAWFCKTDEKWGGFSNMACGNNGRRLFPLRLNGHSIPCSEHLYQSLRYTHRPERQAEILDTGSPKGAKMKAKKNRDTETRPDFNAISDGLMWWTLRVKLACNPVKFATLLRESGDLPIVEVAAQTSPGALHWGTVDDKAVLNRLTGSNVLGRQLMLLRSIVLNRSESDWRFVAPPHVPDFNLLEEPIKAVDFRITAR